MRVSALLHRVGVVLACCVIMIVIKIYDEIRNASSQSKAFKYMHAFYCIYMQAHEFAYRPIFFEM